MSAGYPSPEIRRSEGYPRTGYVTPGCVRGRHLAREPTVLSRRRRGSRPSSVPGLAALCFFFCEWGLESPSDRLRGAVLLRFSLRSFGSDDFVFSEIISLNIGNTHTHTHTQTHTHTHPPGPGRAWPCLLYTSPSPRDKRQSRMPSSA